MTRRRQALAGLLATPFAGACAPRTAPPIDGTFLDTGDGNFNNPNNWSGKVVPSGTVQGNVTLETAHVVPGTIQQGAGTLTIVGGYTQVGGSPLF
jgi:hypothetical protein